MKLLLIVAGIGFGALIVIGIIGLILIIIGSKNWTDFY